MAALTVLSTLLISLGALIRIPMYPVSITLQTYFVYITALLLPPGNALVAVLLYLILGVLGLPVFTSGGGISALVSPTGGFIFAFPMAVLAGSLIIHRKQTSFPHNMLAIVVMEALTNLIGLPWLMLNYKCTAMETLKTGFLPYVQGDIIKMIAAAATVRLLYPKMDSISSLLTIRLLRNEGEAD